MLIFPVITVFYIDFFSDYDLKIGRQLALLGKSLGTVNYDLKMSKIGRKSVIPL